MPWVGMNAQNAGPQLTLYRVRTPLTTMSRRAWMCLPARGYAGGLIDEIGSRTR
jgi:hypothetical protein